MADEPYVTPATMPTPYEAELLTIFMEECAEAIKRASKLKRFGRDEVQHGQSLSNSYRLGHEIGDLEIMIDLLTQCELVRVTSIMEGRAHKRLQLLKFMQNKKD